MKQIVILMMFAFNLNASTLPYQSWESLVAAPQPEMYGFLKDSPSFKSQFKAATDSRLQELIDPIDPTTTDPIEIAKLRLAKDILQGKENSPAFMFLFNDLFNSSYVTIGPDYYVMRDQYLDAVTLRFENLSLRWNK